MSKNPGKNKENLERTHKAFLEIARAEFTEFGYADASTSRIVQTSGMARGSLYYHFGDKNGLFKAVYEEIMFEGLTSITQRMAASKSSWDSLLNGTHAFLDLCMDQTYRKIVLIESQSAMSYKERFAIHEKTLLGELKKILPELIEEGHFKGHTLETLSIFIFGILAEIGRTLDISENMAQSRALLQDAFDATLNMMRNPAHGN